VLKEVREWQNRPLEKRAYMRDQRPPGLPIVEGCRLMGIARSTFYDAPPAKLGDAEIIARIRAICDEFEAYGYRRVTAALRHQGLVRFAQEASWREDHRREANGEQVDRVVALAMANRPSVDFCGYWQRAQNVQ